MRLISQLINSILRVLQKLPKFFNGTAISTSFVLPVAMVILVILTLDSYNSEFGIAVSSDSSL